MDTVTSVSPHIKTGNDTKNIMLDVIIALSPAALFGVVIFGLPALVTIAVCVASCILTEALWCYIFKKPLSTGDLSAAVTGLLLGMNLPAAIPPYIAAAGGVFAMIFGKLVFGGLGKNLVNPAILGRVFLLTAFAGAMTSYTEPFSDLVATATPLSGGEYEVNELVFGVMGGTVGETSAVMLAFGGLYLVFRRVITPTIPLAFLASAGLIGMFAGQSLAVTLCTGGIMLGAIFMATDYVTTPMTFTGKVIFGVGCGVITMVIRLFASLPEGVSYSILIMNLLTPVIDRVFIPRPVGTDDRSERRVGKCSELLEKIKRSITG